MKPKTKKIIGWIILAMVFVVVPMFIYPIIKYGFLVGILAGIICLIKYTATIGLILLAIKLICENDKTS